MEEADNSLTPLIGNHPTIKRKYLAEAGLHLFTGGPAMFRPSDVYRFANYPQFRSVLEGTNVYLICRRRRISVCPHSIEVKGGELYGEFIVHGDSYFEWERERFVHFQKIPKYNAVNALNGYRTIEIFSPFQVIDYGDS